MVWYFFIELDIAALPIRDPLGMSIAILSVQRKPEYATKPVEHENETI